MIRKVLLALGLILLSSAPAFSQSTTVSGQITDAGAQSWNNGTFTFTFVPSANNPVGPYTWTGGALQTTIVGSLSGTGSYSVSIPSNSAISPVNSAWTIRFCPQASAGCFTVSNVAITGATQTINATPPAILINVQAIPPPVLAYSTTEVTGAVIGSQFYLLGTGGGLQVCNAVSGNSCTTWAAAGGGTAIGSTGSGVFNFANYGAVDDDTTDNCANGSVAAFTTAVNAYSGPGVAQAIIPAGAANKAYKMATNANSCTFAFTRTGGVDVRVWGTIDCAQTAQSCMQLGPSGLVAEQNGLFFTVAGGGTFINGANLTLAGIYVEPGVQQFDISHLQLGMGVGFTGALAGFGATNATLGNCTNYGIYVDAPVATGYISYVYDFLPSTDVTHGGCGIANPNGGGAGVGGGGTNTVFFEHNVVSTGGAVGYTQCGSQGIIDGGAYGMSLDNNVYGIAVPIRVQGVGHRAIGNQIDASGCAAHGVNAAFHIGTAGSNAPISPITLDGNVCQCTGSLHTTNLMAIAGDSTATLSGATITGNQNAIGGQVATGGALMPSTLNCAPSATAFNASFCTVSGNYGFAPITPTGATQTGWLSTLGTLASLTPAVQTANLGSTLIVTAPISRTYFVYCQVVETVAGSVSSTLPSCQIIYNNNIAGGASTTQTITVTNTSNVVGATQSGFAVLNIAAGQTINLLTTGYASSAAGMTYQVQAYVGTF